VRALASATLLAGLLTAVPLNSKQASPAETAFTAFLSAASQADAVRRIDAVVTARPPFVDALSRLRQGRTYAANVPRGLQFGRTRTSDNIDHEYVFDVPQTYEPSRAYPVRFHLHGGVSRTRPVAPARIRTNALRSTIEEIVVFPIGWLQSPWWSASQIDNLARILDRLKRTYNVDENRVYLTGSSDGGTGVYFMAFTNTTPWASFVPLIGDMMVLSAPDIPGQLDIFPGNGINKPFLAANGGRDPLYPAHVVRMTIDHLNSLGGQALFREFPDSGHSTAWWPEFQASFQEFVADHVREPLPDSLSWETSRTDQFNRAHWLVISELGAVTGESRLPDTNLLRPGRQYDFGLRISSTVDRGRRATEILPGSNAAAIGLRAGDRLVAIDGNDVKEGGDIAREIQRWNVGDPLRIMVERGGRRFALEGRFDPKEVEPPPTPLFPRRRPSGRVDVVRRGNSVEALTQGVRAFTLLLSPSVFNFSQPVKVVANGRTVFDAMVEPSVATMLKWASVDDDRSMIFGAELRVDLSDPR
jgi:hypothetical protein